jgi:hypothetical protein
MPAKSTAKSSRSIGSYQGVPIERLTKAKMLEVIRAMRAKILHLENERLEDSKLLRKP